MKVLIINGPNLNLLGSREPAIYGDQTFEEYLTSLRDKFKEIDIDYFQSNVEGEIITSLQKAQGKYTGVVLNAGGYTHTSVAIGDAVSAIEIPVIEVHISNILSREEKRHISMIGSSCAGMISGLGLAVYALGIEYLTNYHSS